MSEQAIESVPGITDWGIPDWRDASAYPTLGLEGDQTALPDFFWKWEFLRRDPQYRQDWQTHRRQAHPKVLAFSREDDQTLERDVDFYPEEYPEIWPEVWRLIRVYGLARLPHPGLARPNLLSFRAVPEDEVLISIDLAQSLRPQLDNYFRYLKKHQKHGYQKLKRTREVDRQKWPLLLRILDAREVGCPFYQIGQDLLRISPKKDKEVIVSNAEAEYNLARDMWKKIILPRQLDLPGLEPMELCFESDFRSVFPPDMPRRVLPILYP